MDAKQNPAMAALRHHVSGAVERGEAEPVEAVECLEGPDGCKGAVEFRMALSGTGRSFPRCEAHWEKRLDEQERINRDYPDSPVAPAWFDESAAGERWDDDY